MHFYLNFGGLDFIKLLRASLSALTSATQATIIEETTFSEASCRLPTWSKKSARWVMEPSMDIGYIGFSVCLHPVLIVAAPRRELVL